MHRYLTPLAVVVVVLCLGMPALAAEPQLAHMVFFTLKDNSEGSVEQLVKGCQEFLSEHEGTLYFSVGVRAKDMNRDVNDKEFDVALHLVFCDKAAHDKYSTHPRHMKFIEEFQDNWAKVRVFDSLLPAAPEAKAGDAPIYLPDPAAHFAGMIAGEVVEVREGRIVVLVSAVPKQWEHNKAKNAEAMIGKKVVVVGGGSDAIDRFIAGLKTGQKVTLDVAHKEGEVLTILELTEEQREQVRK
jgi:hypothetical protein